ncbi:MAG: DUF2497 domain-containing protein [Alphaproteobacteria bacterium]|nr:DUF2497 domain-containing protein [Alphaproteobacteria bacterium]
MSITNGAGEPSMEEILASIRNIIAQEPPSEKASDQSAADDSAPALSVRPSNASFSASPALSPIGQGAPAAATAFGHRPGQRQELRPQEYAAGGFGASATPGELRYSPGPAPAFERSAGSPAADDFSDVFEEPMHKLPITPSPFAKTEAGADAGSTQREPKLPNGTNGTTPQGRHPAQSAPRGDTPGERAIEPASPPRREFDFGTLRPPRKDETAPVSAASELFGPAKTDSAAEATAPQSDGLGLRLSGASDGEPIADKKGEPPRRQVVIAAMPSKPETPRPASASALFGGEKPELQADATSNNAEPAVDALLSASSDAGVGLKTANVGFLAATPRPIDPSLSMSSETGRAFFDAVSGLTQDQTEAPEVTTAEREVDEPASPGGVDEMAAISASAAPAGAASEPTPPADELSAVEPKSDAAAAATSGAQSLAQGLSVASIVVASDGGKVRTLEDTVAELLRPLLREWLENNMPRIVESALRLEVADSVKNQLDRPPGNANGLGG